MIDRLIYAEYSFRMSSDTVKYGKIFKILLIVALYVATFMPEHNRWHQWQVWVISNEFILALIGVGIYLWRVNFLKKLVLQLGKGITHICELPDPVIVWSGAFIFFCLTYYLSGRLFSHIPAEIDSVAQYVGAKAFAKGHLFAHSHPLPRFFDAQWIINDGKYYTFYPPGHMIFLVICQLLGSQALTNPLLGALTLASTFYLTREIAGRYAAQYSIVLFITSPFIVFLYSEFDNRATALLMCTLLLLFYIRTIKYKYWLDAVYAGMAIGYLAMTRPQVAFAYAIPLMIHASWLFFHVSKRYWKNFAIMGCSAVPFVLFFLYYNMQTTGHAMLTGYVRYFGNWVLPKSAINSSHPWSSFTYNFFRIQSHLKLLHWELFDWPISSFIPAFLMFLMNAQKKYCVLLLGVFYAFFMFLTTTPFTWVIFGPRYLFEISSILIVFTAIAIQRLPAVCRGYINVRVPISGWRGLTYIGLTCFITFGMTHRTQELFYRYENNYRCSYMAFYKNVLATVEKPALVFVPRNGYNCGTTSFPQIFCSIIFTFPPENSDDVIFAMNLGAYNKALMQFYPKRHAYFMGKDIIMRLN